MIQALHTAASGLYSQQTKIDTIANNIANVNTTGFKSKSVSFKDGYYTALSNPGDPASTENLLCGTGVHVSAAGQDFAQGAIEATGSKLDLAIDGDGFFSLMGANGDTVYTRNGSFSVSVEEEGNFLMAVDGSYVLDMNGEKIAVPGDVSKFLVSPDGAVETEDGEPIKFGVYSFANPEGLSSLGGNTFSATDASGDAEEAEGFTLRQGALESSNVDLGSELTGHIEAQRLYSLAGRALQTADEMEGLAINVRR